MQNTLFLHTLYHTTSQAFLTLLFPPFFLCSIFFSLQFSQFHQLLLSSHFLWSLIKPVFFSKHSDHPLEEFFQLWLAWVQIVKYFLKKTFWWGRPEIGFSGWKRTKMRSKGRIKGPTSYWCIDIEKRWKNLGYLGRFGWYKW